MESGVKCPKCGNITREEMIDGILWFTCLCGKMIPSTMEVDGMAVIHSPNVAGDTVLPRTGSKLSKCLQTLVAVGEATTATVARLTDQNTDDTSSQLTVLFGRGLVERVIESRAAGGSTWALSKTAKSALGV